MELLDKIKEQSKKAQKTIVLPESYERRTLKATSIILKEKLARIVLLGDREKIYSIAKREGYNVSDAEIWDPTNHSKKDVYAKDFLEIRRTKGMTIDRAQAQMENPLFVAAMMVKEGDADGYVAGAENTTGDVLRPALQIIKNQEGISVVSGAMIMILPMKEYGDNGIIIVADCGVNPNPTANQLAEIALCSAETGQQLLGMDPKVAMLSFSTKGSARHIMVDKVIAATYLCKEKNPDLKIDGELQFDAAVVPKIGERKAPGSAVAGHANTFIFPDLQSGNIGVKIMERWGGATAIGPILQGMAKPVNDLSRGCSVDDIVNVVAITSVQAINQ
ncbi:MAG: hypothetical protein APF76_11140 [Desulfitibacter sp. BRH_c19]|nr:MAG: hypothetical protein APF76_11140 [Desulfitibacter sp. BRH_c19]